MTNSSTSLSMLLSRYMKGEITDTVWSRFMRLLDADGVTSTERLAFADYVNDLVTEKGVSSLRFPRMKEVRDLLSDTRH